MISAYAFTLPGMRAALAAQVARERMIVQVLACTGGTWEEEERQWQAAALLGGRRCAGGGTEATYRAGRLEPATKGERLIDLVAYLSPQPTRWRR